MLQNFFDTSNCGVYQRQVTAQLVEEPDIALERLRDNLTGLNIQEARQIDSELFNTFRAQFDDVDESSDLAVINEDEEFLPPQIMDTARKVSTPKTISNWVLPAAVLLGVIGGAVGLISLGAGILGLSTIFLAGMASFGVMAGLSLVLTAGVALLAMGVGIGIAALASSQDESQVVSDQVHDSQFKLKHA